MAGECGHPSYYSDFETVFLKLPPALKHRVETSIDEMGIRLAAFPHHRLKTSNRFRLRVGDYRIIYTFDVTSNTLYLLALGHRREIYR